MTIENQPTIYRSTHPDVLAAVADSERRHGEWHTAVGEFGKQYLPSHRVMTMDGGSRRWVAGLHQEGGPELDSPGPEWRWNRAKRIWVPDKRTKEGKVLARQFAELKVEALGDLPGMPTTVMQAPRWHYHGVKLIDGVAYVTWSCGFDVVEDDEAAGFSKWTFDSTMWERCRASEYYTALESEEVAS